MALRSNFPDYIEAIVAPIGRGIARTGVSPNQLTTLGIVLTATAAGLVVVDRPVLGGWVLVAGGLMDTFDGAVARATHASTPFGSFYDSISDRLSDGIILAGIAWSVSDDPRLFVLAAVALVAAQVTSYVRAKAEAIDLSCSIGILERAERAILLMAGLVFSSFSILGVGMLEIVLWLLAVGGVVTIVQRIHHVWCQIDRDLPEEILALTRGDRAWNRAFTVAARSFYGDKNFDSAVERDPATEPTGATTTGPGR